MCISKQPLALYVDVWYTGKPGTPEAGGCMVYEGDTVKSGLKEMKRLHKEGKAEVRMYVRSTDGNPANNCTYYYEGGKIKKEYDNYNN